jgi:hypothetical protein
MAWEFHVLVVANITATSDELLSCLKARAERGACQFTLLMPRSGPDAEKGLAAAQRAMRQAGLGKVKGRLGDPDPIVAVMEVWDPLEFDEIVVSTLPTGVSRWLGLDLPRRLERLTAVTVRHVVAQPRQEVHWERPNEHEDYGVLSPLAAALTRRP